jgi:hypothetical protein
MAFILWILAVVLVVSGILALFRRQLLWGIVLIIVGPSSCRRSPQVSSSIRSTSPD